MIKLKNVNYRYKNGSESAGLRGINLEIKKGEIVLICGESGCGKTTIARLINGLIPNYFEGELSGSVTINNMEISNMPLYEVAKIVGTVFQNPRSQFFNVDTTGEIAFGCENFGLKEDEIVCRIHKTVSDFKIQYLMNRNIFNLSGGEKQKIACASVSATSPDIFVLDEPTSNLDIFAIKDILKMINKWKKENKTIVITEHRLFFLRNIIDRIIFIKNGRIAKKFSKKEILQLDNNKTNKMGLRSIFLDKLETRKNNRKEKNEIKINDFDFYYLNKKRFRLNVENLVLPEKGIIAVIGKNGSGKSTLARAISGLVKNKNKKERNRRRKRKRQSKKCYMVMQDVNHQLFTESVLDEVLLSMDKEDINKANKILESLDLVKMKNLHPMSLSGGEKQRVAIASAIASQRKIIILDEPTSGLDLRHMKEVIENINKLQKNKKTVLVISHDYEFILSVCTYVLHIGNGTLKKIYPLNKTGQNRLREFFCI